MEAGVRRVVFAILCVVLSAAAAVAGEFVPTVDASMEGGRRPVLTASTNLPEGTKIVVTVTGYPFRIFASNWEEPFKPEWRRYQEEAYAEVVDGNFRVGPFSDGPYEMLSGVYQVAIRVAPPEVQPLAVRAVFGQHGENLSGPLIVREPSPIFGTAVTILVNMEYRAW
jgi:hypothetical protein